MSGSIQGEMTQNVIREPKQVLRDAIARRGSTGPAGVPVTEPVGAPDFNVFAATATTGMETALVDEFEGDQTWVGGLPGDTASTGQWIQADPVATAAQPENDHTPDSGNTCWITGNAPPGSGLGENDVDGGVTTLLSAPLDATDGPENGFAVVEYWRWYSKPEFGLSELCGGI